ncbi:MAG: hypothetical protein OJF62_002415 [Pseudolabrys sp.]|nr:hypothetical protein [Pseudolabrys sp.]
MKRTLLTVAAHDIHASHQRLADKMLAAIVFGLTGDRCKS